MCMAYEKSCSCGARSASFHFRDNVLPEQIVKDLYCPSCAREIALNPADMVRDNGWVIRYDMDMARFLTVGKIQGSITPDVLFDEGYCTWNGMYPGDHLDSVKEREKITALAKTNPVEYLKKLKTWAVERSERLKDEGWRKAQNAA